MSIKEAIWNTIEQYTGLKFLAASPFSEISFKKPQKSQNRHFSAFEQYGRLESCTGPVRAGSGGQE